MALASSHSAPTCRVQFATACANAQLAAEASGSGAPSSLSNIWPSLPYVAPRHSSAATIEAGVYISEMQPDSAVAGSEGQVGEPVHGEFRLVRGSSVRRTVNVHTQPCGRDQYGGDGQRSRFHHVRVPSLDHDLRHGMDLVGSTVRVGAGQSIRPSVGPLLAVPPSELFRLAWLRYQRAGVFACSGGGGVFIIPASLGGDPGRPGRVTPNSGGLRPCLSSDASIGSPSRGSRGR